MFILIASYIILSAMATNFILDELVVRSGNPSYEVMYKTPFLIFPCIVTGWLMMWLLIALMIPRMIQNKFKLEPSLKELAIDIFNKDNEE